MLHLERKMTVFEGVSCVVMVATLIVAVAALDPEKRAWAKKQAAGLLAALFFVFCIGTAVVGVTTFGLADGPPTRGQILMLVMYLFNGFMGIHFVMDAISARRLEPSRKALAQAQADALATMESYRPAAASTVEKSQS
jgi:hypothetical protein